MESTQVTDLLVATARPFPSLGILCVRNVWSGQCGARMVDCIPRTAGDGSTVVVTQPRLSPYQQGRRPHLTVEETESPHISGLVPESISERECSHDTTPALAASDNNVEYAVS